MKFLSFENTYRHGVYGYGTIPQLVQMRLSSLDIFGPQQKQAFRKVVLHFFSAFSALSHLSIREPQEPLVGFPPAYPLCPLTQSIVLAPVTGHISMPVKVSTTARGPRGFLLHWCHCQRHQCQSMIRCRHPCKTPTQHQSKLAQCPLQNN